MGFKVKHFQSAVVMGGTVRLDSFMGDLSKGSESGLAAQVEEVTVQAQDGDVRYTLDGSEVTGLNGVILADGALVKIQNVDFDKVLFFPVVVDVPKLSGHIFFK